MAFAYDVHGGKGTAVLEGMSEHASEKQEKDSSRRMSPIKFIHIVAKKAIQTNCMPRCMCGLCKPMRQQHNSVTNASRACHAPCASMHQHNC